ncbi:hypothetical protein NDU88_000637 [Pleurodeles waltl]|uniref:Uncharacterized protein n=1 Tax=Pleurodeles waltl TaxID=8319 RepID=A0AAV7MK94_PLEWA|nr:hypothetical protein NDU88_000637 [Pleurodeles waltl]
MSLLSLVRLLEMQECGDEGPFQSVYSPTQGKQQPAVDHYDTFQEHYPYDKPYEEDQGSHDNTISIPMCLVTDIRHMLNDYYKRFPEASAPVQHTPAPLEAPIRADFIDSDGEEQQVEGEIPQDPSGDY